MAGPSFEPGRPTAPQTLFTSAPVATAGLPPGVRGKLEAILEYTDAKHRQVPLFQERYAANSERGDAERRLARLVAHPHDNNGFGLRATDVRVIQRKKLVEELTATAQRLHARYERTSAAWEVAAARAIERRDMAKSDRTARPLRIHPSQNRSWRRARICWMASNVFGGALVNYKPTRTASGPHRSHRRTPSNACAQPSRVWRRWGRQW